MNTERFDEQDAWALALRYGIPSLAWGGVIAFFAVAGAVSTPESVLTSKDASRPSISRADVRMSSAAPSASRTKTPATNASAVASTDMH